MSARNYPTLRQPSREVSPDRMREILGRNSKAAWPTAPKQNAPTTQPPRPVGPLQWAPREAGSMGRYDTSHWYSCCQINRGDVATFEAWTREPLTGGMKQIAVGLSTFRAAIDACQKDADEHYARGDR